VAGERRFGRPHDHPFFVDPDARWNVDDAKKRAERMLLIDQRRMRRGDLLDNAARRLRVGVQGDGDDLEPLPM
jgi:hypothetical protein